MAPGCPRRASGCIFFMFLAILVQILYKIKRSKRKDSTETLYPPSERESTCPLLGGGKLTAFCWILICWLFQLLVLPCREVNRIRMKDFCFCVKIGSSIKQTHTYRHMYWRIVNLLNRRGRPTVRQIARWTRGKTTAFIKRNKCYLIIIESNCNWNNFNVKKITRFLFKRKKNGETQNIAEAATANPVIIRNYNYKNKLNKKKMQTRARPSEILDGRYQRWASNYL